MKMVFNNFGKKYGFIILFILIKIISASSLKLDVTCSVNSDCEPLFGKEGRCENNHCVCTSPNGCKNHPPKVTVIGAPCVEDEVCNIENSICQNSSCQCKSEYFSSKDNKTCITKVQILQPCEEDIQCTASTANTYCTKEKRCNCTEGYKKDKFSCYKMINLNGPCKSDPECNHIPEAICDNSSGLCKCRPSASIVNKLVESEDGLRCLPAAKSVNDPCREDAQCKKVLGEGALCSGEICNCDENHKFVNGTCENISRLNKHCKVDEDCRNLDGTLLMQCISEICKCSPEYVESENICISSAISYSSNFFLFLISFTFLYFSTDL